MPMTLAFSCEVVHKKNYENPSIFVKVTAKKTVAPFFLDTMWIIINVIDSTSGGGMADPGGGKVAVRHCEYQ